MLEALSLEGKSVAITGGGTGLGLAMVRAMARAGANIAIAGRRQQPIDDAAAEVVAFGRDALAVSTDVADSAQVDHFIKAAIDRFGRIDVLINNSGTVGDGHLAIWEISDAEWHRVLGVNLTGAFYCARAASRPMMEQGKGKIINVASGFGMRGGRDITIYCTSKGGLIQLTRALSFNLARYGITVNSIIPGFVPTDITMGTRDVMPQGDFLPIGKLGTPEDFGPLAVFLASDASDYMTGEMFFADGGGLAAGVAPAGHAPIIPLEA